MNGVVPIFSWLTALEAYRPEANSLHEYVTHEVIRAVPDHQALMSLVSGRYSLNDLVRYADQRGFGDSFDLMPGADPVGRFIRSAASRSVESDAFLLGAAFIAETFDAALCGPERHETETALATAAKGPFAWLQMNRLFHLLLSSDHLYKVAEIDSFPWNACGPMETGFGEGTLATGFLKGERVGSAFRELADAGKIHEAESLNLCWKIWSTSFSRLVSRFDGDWAGLMSALLMIQPTKASRDVSKRLRSREIDVEVVTAREMEVRRRKRREPVTASDEIVADYVLPDGVRRKPTILLLDPREPGRSLDPHAALLLAARVVHEAGVHLRQVEDRGSDWPDRNVVEAEVEAHVQESLFRLQNGDDSLDRKIANYSPLGFGLAVRNYVEHLYIRQSEPLPPIFP